MEEPESPMQRAADEALRILREPPPLAIIAVIAAMIELLLARVIWQSQIFDIELLRQLHDIARFPRNIAAVSGIVALLFGIFSFLRLPGFAPIARRLVIAAFSGVFVPGVVVATMLPYASLRRRLVIFGLAAANVLVTLLGMTALRNRPHPGVRIASGLVAATAFISLLWVGLGQIAISDTDGPFRWITIITSTDPSRTRTALLGLRHLGELAWLGVLFAATFTILHRGERDRNRRYIVGGITLLISVACVVALSLAVGHRFRFVIFGSLRLGLFQDSLASIYALPIGVALVGGVVGLLQKEHPTRQLAGAVLLWLAAGYAPHTPIQLLYFVLSAMLFNRSAQALDPDGVWRLRNPWLRLLTRPRGEGGG